MKPQRKATVPHPLATMLTHEEKRKLLHVVTLIARTIVKAKGGAK